MRPGPAGDGGVVRTTYGQVSGLRTADGAVEVFAGVLDARPPVGDLRWRPPVPPQPWTGVRPRRRSVTCRCLPRWAPAAESPHGVVEPGERSGMRARPRAEAVDFRLGHDGPVA